jgi:hypothetical protein
MNKALHYRLLIKLESKIQGKQVSTVIEGATVFTQPVEVLRYTEDKLLSMMQEKHLWHLLPCIIFTLQQLTEILMSVVSGAIKTTIRHITQEEVSIIYDYN